MRQSTIFFLLKRLNPILFLFMCGQFSFSQECSVCDHYLDVIYDKTSLKVSSDFSGSFATWFFSDEFEKDVKASSAGLNFTIPFDGVPITFGGKYESDDAWEKRKVNSGSTKWDFSKISRSSIFTQVASEEARKVWLQCVEYACSKRNDLFPVSQKVDESSALITISYNSTLIDNVPKFHSFICSGGLDCSVANSSLRGKPMNKRGQAIKFKWLNSTSEDGLIVINTTNGASQPILVRRELKPNSGFLAYAKDTVGPDILITKSSAGPETFVAGWDKEPGCYGGCEACWEGKYCVKMTLVTYNAPQGFVLKNPVVKCSPRAGQCPWTYVVTQPSNGANNTYYQAKIGNFGGSSMYYIEADLFAQTKVQKVVTEPINVIGSKLLISVPNSVAFPIVTINARNKWILFRPDQNLSTDVKLEKVVHGDTSTSYEYTVR